MNQCTPYTKQRAGATRQKHLRHLLLHWNPRAAVTLKILSIVLTGTFCAVQALQHQQQEHHSSISTEPYPVLALKQLCDASEERTCKLIADAYRSADALALMAGQRVAAFAWQLQKQVSESNGVKDAPVVFVSPLSLYIALGLAMNGAGTNTSTQEELYHLLHQDKSRLLGLVAPKAPHDQDIKELSAGISSLSSSLVQESKEDGPTLIVANAVWTNKVEVKADYAAEMLKLFQAEVKQASTVDVINEWAEKVTKGLIKQAVPPGTPFDLVLTNAVYFKGLWEFQFKKEATSKHAFMLEGGSETQVDMMSRTFKASEMSHNTAQVKYVQTSSYQAVRLPYKGGAVTAVIVLPNADTAKHGVASAVGKLDIGQLLDVDKYQRVGPGGLVVHLPKFKVQTECVSLSKHVQALGVKAAFTQKVADFSRLSDAELYISDILQSVCVIVDEEGTEAAAVTAVVMLRAMAAPHPPVTIKFDRPFLFMLVDDATSTPLFVGTVSDPSK